MKSSLLKRFFLVATAFLFATSWLFAQPVNDNCGALITLTSSPTCNGQVFSTASATQSLAPVSCNGATSTAANDVWFAFSPGGPGDSVIVAPSGAFDPVVEVFSGICSSPVSIGCSDDPSTGGATEKVAPGNLVPGILYWVRVYGWGGIAGSFSICIKQVASNPQPLANDDCSGAITLVSSASCNSQVYSNTNATQTLAPALCSGFTSTSANDVWFRFTAGTAGDSLILAPSGSFDGVLQLFSGSCGSLLSLGCSDNSGGSSSEKIAPGNLIPGQTYYARVYGWGGVSGSFRICVKQPNLFPVNDNCGVNVILTPGITCNPQTYSNVNATQSLAPSVCGSSLSSSAQDVWFAFGALTATDSIFVFPVGNFNPVVEVFSGICSNLTSIGCSNNPFSAAATEKVVPGGLSPGIVYWVRVYGFNGSQGQFSICVRQGTSAPPPSNDNCSAGVTLVPAAVCSGQLYSNAGATESLAPVTCNGSTSAAARDVWFSFVASGSGDSVIVSPAGTFDPIVELFSGSCAGPVSLACSDDPNNGSATEKIATGGLSAGTTYRVRVYGWSGLEGQFSICIKQPAGAAPANDNCSAAINLVSALSCNAQTFSNNGATQSLAPTACGGLPSTSAQDVWFKFGPAQTANDTVIVSPVGNFNPVVEVYSGLCSNPTSIGCSNNMFNPAATEKVSPGNLNLSLIYWVRVYGFNGSQGSFNICVKAGSSGPAITNDDCISAVAAPVASSCNGNLGSTVGATQSLPPASCNGGTSTSASDVWYSFTAVTPGDTVIVGPIGSFDPVVQLFSGSCAALSGIGCSDGPNATDIEKVAPGNLVPGQTYYFRVYGWNGSSGSFGYCVKSTGSCSSVAGTLTVNPAETVSNSLVKLNLTGSSAGASVQWQASLDNINWSNAGTPVFQVADTFYITSAITQTYYLRAQVTLGNCATANSASVPLAVSCATPITNKEPALSGYGISSVNFAGINNQSFSPVLSGAYQNFRNISGNVCKGGTYPLSITAIQNNSSAKAVWIDFNNNGLFTDAGENVVAPIVTTGNYSSNITIPVGAVTGTVRMRLMLYSPGTSFPSSDPCFAGPYEAGEIEEYSIAIGNAPTASNAGSNANICGFSHTLSANTPVNGTGQWTVVSGSGNFSNAFSPTATVSGLSIGANIFRWTISTACSSSVSEVVVTSSGSSLTATAGPDQSICGGQAVVSANTPAAGTGLWTVVSGSGVFANPSNPSTTIAGLAAGINIFRWTVSNPPCTPVFDDVQITNVGSSAVVAQAGTDQAICQGSAVLAGNSPGSGNGLWTVVAGSGNISNPTSPTAAVSNLGAGANVLRWTIVTGNCPVSYDDVLITRDLPPSAANAGTDQAICSAQTFLSATPPTTGTGQWTLIVGSGIINNPLNPSTTVTGLGNGNTVFRWTVYNGVCNPVTDDVIVATNLSAVAANAGPDQILCGTSANLNANATGNGTGQWTVVAGSGTFSNPSSPTSSVTGLSAGTNIFRWTITSPGCNPTSDEVQLVRNQPAIAVAGADQSLCTDQTSLAATSSSSGTGSWLLVSGSGTILNPNSPTTLVTGLGNGQNVFRWTVANPPCLPVSDDVVITTNLSAVAANAGADVSVCGTAALLSGNNPGNGTGTWALVQGSGVIANPASPSTSVTGLGSGTNIFSWTVTPGGACAPSTDFVSIQSVQPPASANAGQDQSVCGNTAVLSGNPAGNGLWTIVSGSGDILSPENAATQVTNLGAGVNVLRWTLSNAPCPSSSDDVLITSTPSGLVASAGQDQTVCGTTAVLNALVPGNGSGTWTVISGGASLSQAGNPVSSVSGLASGPNEFLWTVTSGACSASDLVTIVREPDLLNLGNDTLICSGENLQLVAGQAYQAYLWSDNSSGPSLVVSQAGDYWLQAVSAYGCIFTDTIRVLYIPCTSVNDQVEADQESLQVQPNPSSGYFTVTDFSADAAGTVYRVFSSEGKVLAVKKSGQEKGNAVISAIDLSGFSAGLYLLEASSKSGRRTRKIIVR